MFYDRVTLQQFSISNKGSRYGGKWIMLRDETTEFIVPCELKYSLALHQS